LPLTSTSLINPGCYFRATGLPILVSDSAQAKPFLTKAFLIIYPLSKNRMIFGKKIGVVLPTGTRPDAPFTA
jgi:hypothetical protein